MSERVQARLRLIALLREIPLDADLELDVKYLTRTDYNAMIGWREFSFGYTRLMWTKDVQDEGVTVTFYTREPPLTDWAEVARTEALRVIPGGQS